MYTKQFSYRVVLTQKCVCVYVNLQKNNISWQTRHVLSNPVIQIHDIYMFTLLKIEIITHTTSNILQHDSKLRMSYRDFTHDFFFLFKLG